MSVEPAVNAVTSPVAGFTLAIAGLVLLHVPPEVPLLVNNEVNPPHSDDAPLTVPAETLGLTVSNPESVNTSPQLLFALSLYLFVLNEILGFVIVSVFEFMPL